MGRTLKLAVLAAAVVGVGTVAVTGPVNVGEAVLDVAVVVDIDVRGIDPATIDAGLSLEFYEMPGGTPVPGNGNCDDPAGTLQNPYRHSTTDISCTLPGEIALSQDYAIGIAGAPADYQVYANCGVTVVAEQITSGQPEFTIDPGTVQVDCSVGVESWILLLDKVVAGGTATSTDFELEAYDSGGTNVGSGSDPADATCETDYDPTTCLALALPPGQAYVVGEVPVDYGYEVTNVTCDQYINVERGGGQNPAEMIELPGATFDHDDGDTYCSVTNTHREGQLQVTTVVNNDEGGTASATDVSIEVFRSDGTEVVAATACAADGTCLDTMLPTGDYVIGYVGPAGYTRTISQTITTPTEQVTDDPNAAFTMGPSDVVEIVVTIDDPTPPTTTVAPTTTLAPTTTALGAGAGTLPATGTSSTANTWMTAAALLFVGLGVVLLTVRRRPA